MDGRVASARAASFDQTTGFTTNDGGAAPQKMRLMREYKKCDGSLTFWSSFCAVRLHCYMRIQVVQRPVRLLASVPTALIHPLNFFIASSRSLVLLRSRNRNKRVHGRQRMTALHYVRRVWNKW
jgi:hypothetical protein